MVGFFFFPPLWTLKEIVLLLLRYDACASIINGTAQIPKDVTEDDEIITMLEGMKSLGAFFLMSDGFSLLKISCLCSQVLIWFVQLQRGERQGGMRRSFWKQPERGIYPLCLNWLVSDLSKKFGRK